MGFLVNARLRLKAAETIQWWRGFEADVIQKLDWFNSLTTVVRVAVRHGPYDVESPISSKT